MLIVMTHQQIMNSRGQCVREQMEIVLRILQGNIDKMVNSIVPIITKVKPTQQGEETEFDIDTIRQDLNEVFDQWLSNYCKEKKLLQSRITHIDALIDDATEENPLATDIQSIDFSSLDDFEDLADNDIELMP